MPKMIVSLDGVVIKEVQLSKDRTSLGRRPYNDIVIDNLAVSGEQVFKLSVVAGKGGQGLADGGHMGDLPLVRRIPKRGFHNRWAETVFGVNLEDIDLVIEILREKIAALLTP